VNSAKGFAVKCWDYYSTTPTTPPQKQGSPYDETTGGNFYPTYDYWEEYYLGDEVVNDGVYLRYVNQNPTQGAPTGSTTWWVEFTPPGGNPRGMIFYNGVQQTIPYDYTPLNYLQGNNLQWVMSGATSGKFLTDAPEYRIDNNDAAFLYFLTDSQNLPTKIKYTIYYWGTGWTQESIPEVFMDNYIGLPNGFESLQSYSESMVMTKPISAGYEYDTYQKTTATYIASNTPPPVRYVPPIVPKTNIYTTVVYDTNVSALYSDSKMFYFPMSMRQLIDQSLVTTSIQNRWLYYTVDLVGITPPYSDYCKDESNQPVYMPVGSAIYDSQNENEYDLVDSGGTVIHLNVHRVGLPLWHSGTGLAYVSKSCDAGENVMSKKPFYVYRREKCDKYSRWQMFWLNPNGGFDRFTFTMKMDVNYKVNRTAYKQRYAAGTATEFDTYFSGENIFNTKIDEEVTLRSDSVTQSESQLLIQMFQSPKIFLQREYFYEPTDPTAVYAYGVPYIITSTEMKYEQKINSKMIYYEIKVKPANQKNVQQY
jgi:hypothetical protein